MEELGFEPSLSRSEPWVWPLDVVPNGASASWVPLGESVSWCQQHLQLLPACPSSVQLPPQGKAGEETMWMHRASIPGLP